MSSAAARAAQRAAAATRRLFVGQPTPETHPELLRVGEIQPGIAAEEFALRRQQLAERLPDGGVAVLQASRQVFMSGVVPYPYRQEANFQYLTGIQQHGALAVIRSDGHFALYVPDPDSWREAWDGARLSTDAAIDFFGADEAYATSELPQRLNATLASAPMIAMDIDRSESSAPSTPAAAQLTALRSAESQGRVQPLKPLVHQLRWSKSAAELGLMRQSAAAATSAMMECMRASHPGVSEHFLASLFEWRCKAAGAQRMAYPPVVAGGADGVTIHYSRNDKQLGKEDLLLLDGGCEYFGYCSDVTRTWPIGGKFTSPQLAVYEAVLATHQQLIAACRPGTTMRQLHQLSVRLLAEALRTLGVLRNVSVESIVANQSYRTFYPHSVGHLLGMDVHDANTNSHDRPLEPGVVLTIEPGLYIPDDPIFGALRGIGVRLEDDVAVTRGGPEVLSEMAPLNPTEVEDLVGEAVEEGRGGLAGA